MTQPRRAIWAEVIRLKTEGMTHRKIAETVGRSETSIERILKTIREEAPLETARLKLRNLVLDMWSRGDSRQKIANKLEIEDRVVRQIIDSARRVGDKRAKSKYNEARERYKRVIDSWNSGKTILEISIQESTTQKLIKGIIHRGRKNNEANRRGRWNLSDFCRRGHQMAGENLGIMRNGSRYCIKCRRLSDKTRYYLDKEHEYYLSKLENDGGEE